jgi:hypothetical protein
MRRAAPGELTPAGGAVAGRGGGAAAALAAAGLGAPAKASAPRHGPALPGRPVAAAAAAAGAAAGPRPPRASGNGFAGAGAGGAGGAATAGLAPPLPSPLLALPPRLVAEHIVRGRLLPWEAGQLARTCRRGRAIACASVDALVLRDARFAAVSGTLSRRPSSAGSRGVSSAGGSGAFGGGGLASAGPSGNWWGSAVASAAVPPGGGALAAAVAAAAAAAAPGDAPPPALAPRSRRTTEELLAASPAPFTACAAVVLRPRTLPALSKMVTGLLLPGLLRARLPALAELAIEVHDALSSQCDLSLQLTAVALHARGVARLRLDQPGLFTVRQALAVARMPALEALTIMSTEARGQEWAGRRGVGEELPVGTCWEQDLKCWRYSRGLAWPVRLRSSSAWAAAHGSRRRDP